MVKSWEEDFWLVTPILNSVLGAHLVLRKIFFSWSPAIPILGAIVVDQCARLHSFTNTYRHKNYFTTKRKLFISLCLETIFVSLSEWIFTSMGYPWVFLFAWLAYAIPGLWAIFRRPCHIPPASPVDFAYHPFLNIIGFVLWLLWQENDGCASQVSVGFIMLGLSSELFVYHEYMEAYRMMGNPEYCEWLVQEIEGGAVGMTQMLADLFVARGYLPAALFRLHPSSTV